MARTPKRKVKRAKRAIPRRVRPGVKPAGDGGVLWAIAEKQKQGRPLSRDDRRVLERSRKAQEELAFTRRCRAVPKKWIAEASGRQHNQLNEWAIRYGTPVAGPTVDLAEFVRWALDFLARNGRKLSAVNGDDPMSGPGSAALENWRREKWLLARLDRQARQGQLLPRRDVQEHLGRLADLLRGAAERLEKQHGAEARRLLDEALDDFERGVKVWAQQVDEDGDGQSGAQPGGTG